MGVDISVVVGTGFVIDPDILTQYVKENDPDDEGDTDVLERLLEKYEGLRFGTGGSYYDSGEDNRTWIAIDRLTHGYEAYDMPGGVFGFSKPVITLDDRAKLDAIAAELGQKDIVIGQFLSILWH